MIFRFFTGDRHTCIETMAISLTEEGRTLLEGARQVLSEAEALDSRVRLGAQTLSGLIRVSTAISLRHSTIKSVIDECSC